MNPIKPIIKLKNGVIIWSKRIMSRVIKMIFGRAYGVISAWKGKRKIR